MMPEQFTVEEENLMCCFDTSSRETLIKSIAEALPGLDDPELYEMAQGVTNKLQEMTDEAVAELELFLTDEDYKEV